MPVPRLAGLQELQRNLAQEFQIRIVSRAGEQSGVWRVPQANPRARNFYLIVEALDRDGRPVEVPRHLGGGRHQRARHQMGPARPEAEFERVRQEKMRSGLIGDPVVGREARRGAGAALVHPRHRRGDPEVVTWTC